MPSSWGLPVCARPTDAPSPQQHMACDAALSVMQHMLLGLACSWLVLLVVLPLGIRCPCSCLVQLYMWHHHITEILYEVHGRGHDATRINCCCWASGCTLCDSMLTPNDKDPQLPITHNHRTSRQSLSCMFPGMPTVKYTLEHCST